MSECGKYPHVAKKSGTMPIILYSTASGPPCSMFGGFLEEFYKTFFSSIYITNSV